VDYSFYGVNRETVKMAPQESMQFGEANEQLIAVLTWPDPQFGNCYMYKVDISDGFYCIPLSTSGVPKLGMCLPTFPGLPPLVAFLLVLPMDRPNPPRSYVVSQKQCVTSSLMQNCNGTSDAPSITWKG
jgi:hypothetical protein